MWKEPYRKLFPEALGQGRSACVVLVIGIPFGRVSKNELKPSLALADNPEHALVNGSRYPVPVNVELGLMVVTVLREKFFHTASEPIQPSDPLLEPGGIPS